MPGEELIQRGYLRNGKFSGDHFGRFQHLNLGATSISELIRTGFLKFIADCVNYPFEQYKPPKNPERTKPDGIYFLKLKNEYKIIANVEFKQPKEYITEKKRLYAQEQGLFSGAVLGSPICIISSGKETTYIDVINSIKKKNIIFFNEKRSLNPAVLEELSSPDRGKPRNPGKLAEKCWQAIWHATKEEPKQCLMTFVEIFILKFLSDNLNDTILPQNYTFYELISYKENDFKRRYGKTQIEYYVQEIRAKIKQIFPEKKVVTNNEICSIFGLKTIVSPTSLINGFAFLKSGDTSLSSFNRTFLDILDYFLEFGPLYPIDPEFKLRLYETFLKKTVRQQKLGQFFTPRNIVKAIVNMAQLSKLPKGSIVFDPAAGVGGFILEPLILDNALKNNITFINGLPDIKIRLLGADCDSNTNILAKSNTLIHLSEYIRDPSVTIEGLNQVMAETFIVLNTNQHLGTLEYPIQSKVDVILTNPPYVTQGSKIYKDEINSFKELRNSIDLKDYYDRCGLGLESLFLRYISGALKPGGIAFVIVPQGLLTRTETSTKEKILAECNLLASIALPRNCFYSTPQKTYIIGLQKRRTSVDKRPDVFCAIATSVGESLDARRIPVQDNDLFLISEAYVKASNKIPIDTGIVDKVKIVKAECFGKTERWDVYRFWSDDELVKIGERDGAIDRIELISEAKDRMSEIFDDIRIVEAEIKNLQDGNIKSIKVSDESLFKVEKGIRVTRKMGDLNPGEIPVYSGSKDPKRPICKVSEKWANDNRIPVETEPLITINANGYVGAVFLRKEKCIIHDDVMKLYVLNSSLIKDYIVFALRSAIAEGNYEYEAKLYSRVKQISINIPIKDNGDFDIEKQNLIAEAYKKFDLLVQKISELGQWAVGSRLKN